MNKKIVVGVIAVIIIVVTYTAYQNPSTIGSNQISKNPQIQNVINSTVSQINDTHKVFHITLNDGIGVKSP